MHDPVVRFYCHHLPAARHKRSRIEAPCPFCADQRGAADGVLSVVNTPGQFFHGLFSCSNHCVPGGFPLHFARLLGLDPELVPGFVPDRERIVPEADYPSKNLNNELHLLCEQLTAEQQAPFQRAGIRPELLAALRIGYNGRYLTYPYIQDDGNCYTARCVHPERPEDWFWYGDEQFFAEPFRLFNRQDIACCENGALFLVEGEDGLLALKQLGLPGVAVPSSADLEQTDARQFESIRTLFLWVANSRHAQSRARAFSTRAGFKVRIIQWPKSAPADAMPVSLAISAGTSWPATVAALIRQATSFSPFHSPEAEYQAFNQRLLHDAAPAAARHSGCFPRLDQALGGLHGINILGGAPKAGKSAFCVQIASTMAQAGTPVLYYDFENGRHKLYLRILSRLARRTTAQLGEQQAAGSTDQPTQEALQTLRRTLDRLRVVNDRAISPETMRRHIDFLCHETLCDAVLVVIDSLHKLPFKDISQKRSGIDGWLRQLEAIRDETGAAFLVISELERGEDRHFDSAPHLGSFKGSGDIGYSADNALILLPRWDPMADQAPETRRNELWLVASREHSPGKVATYRVDYPFWGFIEEAPV
ncbi:MAG: DnaB-like helicase C-terminal domain-containing protein [Desulfobulbus sp.]|jgi:replicative DNA helicase